MTEVKNDGSLLIDWNALLQKLSGDRAVDGDATVQAQKTDTGVNLTVTRTSGNGSSVMTYEVPQLSEPKLETQASVLAALMTFGDKVTPATCKEITDVFNKVGRDLTAVALSETTTSAASSHEQTMFDIYDLLRLLQDVGQTLKMTARQAREAALQADMALIKSEAAIQKGAAKLGFGITVGVSLAMCALSVACSFVGMSKSKTAYEKKKSISKTSMTKKTSTTEMTETAAKKENVATKKSAEKDIRNEELRQEDMVEMKDLSTETNATKDANLAEKQNANIENKEAKVQREQEVAGEQTVASEEAVVREREALADEAFDCDQSASKFNSGAMAFLMLGQGLGGVGQSVEQGVGTKGTLLEADQRKSEALRDEMNEMMQDAQAVISAVKDLREAIIQSESQSIDTILRA